MAFVQSSSVGMMALNQQRESSKKYYNYLPPNFNKPYEVGTNMQQVSQDLMNLIFISRIPEAFTDEDMTGLLSTCGTIKGWKRAKKADGSPSHFGFCIFAEGSGVIRALRNLSPERPADYEWTKKDPKFPFIVTADVATRNHLRNHAEMKNMGVRDFEVLERLKFLFAKINFDPEAHNALFQKKDASIPMEVDQTTQSKARVSSAVSNSITRAAEIAKLAEKREADRIHSIKEREKRQEKQDGERIHRFLADQEADVDRAERKVALKEAQGRLFADYGLSLNGEKESDEQAWLDKHLATLEGPEDERIILDIDAFYRDREKWWIKRQKDLGRERDFDKRDRKIVEEEVAQAAKIAAAQQKEREAAARKIAEAAAAAEAQAAALEAARIREEEERAAAELAAAQANINVTRIMTKEERLAAVRALVGSIPSEKEPIWAWPVKWHLLDSNLINKKLIPFLKKKVVEYMGDESPDLVKFIVEKITEHADVQSIYDELSPVLVEETEIFVLKLWRFLIYETEAISLGL